MKKVVLLILPVLFLLIGFDYGMAEVAKVSPELAAARAKYDTPFIKKYRPRYEANIKTFGFEMISYYAREECKKICNSEDKNNIKRLAELGDMFALFMHPQLQSSSKKQLEQFKISADKGEPASITMYGFVTAGMEDYELGKKIISVAKQKDLPDAYVKLWLIAYEKNNYKDFCSVFAEGYNKFGLEFLSGFFVNNNTQFAKLFFDKCIKNKLEDVLEKAGNQGKLIQGYIYVEEGQYDQAYKLFNEIYKPDDGSKISANAGYCLGMMNYYGKGTTKDLEKGRKLLQESFDKGVVYINMPETKEFLLPDKFEIIKYYSGNCNRIS